ncbi:MAG: hypothetical protein HXS44_09870 [Theionarchaea archaeon]|nr:hypothetical protein [Theionarchaea archaeon]
MIVALESEMIDSERTFIDRKTGTKSRCSIREFLLKKRNAELLHRNTEDYCKYEAENRTTEVN